MSDLCLYSAIAGSENCIHRLLENALEMMQEQDQPERLRGLAAQQLILAEITSAVFTAYREVAPKIEVKNEAEVVEIPLRSKKYKGHVAIVDRVDADLAEMNWYPGVAPSNIYAKCAPKRGIPFKMHCVVIERVIGRPLAEGEVVDHINRNGLDNRRENLRLATYKQNSSNRRIQVKNTSGYKGVSWKKSVKKWQAVITLNYKARHLGYYVDILDAARAYNNAAKELFGEFAYLNVIPDSDQSIS